MVQPTYEQLLAQYNGLNSQIQTLRQAMLGNPHNNVMQSDYTHKINILTQEMNGIGQMLQNIQNQQPAQNAYPQQQNQQPIYPQQNQQQNGGYYPQQQNQQPAYPQQPQQQGGYYPQQNQQPAYQANGMFNQLGGNQSSNNKTENYHNASGRYAGRQKQAPQHEYVEQVSETIQEPVLLIPLLGNEYSPYLGLGVSVEQVVMGEFFKYEYKGRNMCKIDPSQILIKKYSVDEKVMCVPKLTGVVDNNTNIFLRANSIENDKQIIAVDVVEYRDSVVEKDSTVTHMKLVGDSNSLGDLSISLVNAYNNCPDENHLELEYITSLDLTIRDGINEILKDVAGSPIVLDSFTGQYQELTEGIAKMNIEDQSNVNGALDSYFSGIEYTDKVKGVVDASATTYKSEKLAVCSAYNLASVVYIDKSINCIDLEEATDNETMMITKNSHSSLYEVLVVCKDSLHAKVSNKLKLLHNGVCYTVYYNIVTNNFTIKK